MLDSDNIRRIAGHCDGAEREILERIADKPASRARRLKYVRWLEERDEIWEADYVRLFEDERIHEYPVWSDEFWSVQPQFKTLHDRVILGDNRVLGMGYRLDPESYLKLDSVPDDWKSRFRIIHAYLNYWHLTNLGDVGGARVHMRIMERGVGRRLTGAVRQLAAMDGELSGAEWNSVMRDNTSFVWLNDPDHGPVLSLVMLAEGDWHWGVKRKDLSRSDPPISTWLPTDGAGADSVVFEKPWSDRLTTWLLDYIVTNNLSPRNQPARLGQALVKAFRKG